MCAVTKLIYLFPKRSIDEQCAKKACVDFLDFNARDTGI